MDLHKLLSRKSLTSEEAMMAKQMMLGERAFGGPESATAKAPVPGLAQPLPPAAPAEKTAAQLVEECSAMEQELATEIAKEVEAIGSEAATTLGSKTISAEDTAAMKKLMRQQSGQHVQGKRPHERSEWR
jgi:hypothetical protein